MPKKIEVTKKTILDETRKIIDNGDYEKLNCREIAKACNIAVGTLYHFFTSKMEILALLLLEDWKNDLSVINCDVPIAEGLKNIYEGIFNFTSKYSALWKYSMATSSEYASYTDRHPLLVKQVSELIIRVFKFNNIELDNDVIEFLTESSLNYATALKDYSKIEKIFVKIIGG